tara:strand:+ start:144 stop:485 length:342 start_codon:yes stop_codon:yes gene_type:complete
MNKGIHLNKFKTLAKDLIKENIIVEFQTDWSKTTLDGSYALSDRPYIGSGNYNGVEGWYFKRNSDDNFTNSEKKTIKQILLKRGFKCKGIHDYEVEWDGDRSYRPSISFILNN